MPLMSQERQRTHMYAPMGSSNDSNSAEPSLCVALSSWKVGRCSAAAKQVAHFISMRASGCVRVDVSE
eukprot:4285915-Pleurochrysis_carterae.AAC.4